jgi:hypothetical protein
VAIALTLFAVVSVRADTIHVPEDYPTIQEGIDAAVDGDEVEWVIQFGTSSGDTASAVLPDTQAGIFVAGRGASGILTLDWPFCRWIEGTSGAQGSHGGGAAVGQAVCDTRARRATSAREEGK